MVATTGAFKTCKAPVKSSPSTNQHPTFYRPDTLPVAQSTCVRALKERTLQTYLCSLYTTVITVIIGTVSKCYYSLPRTMRSGDAIVGSDVELVRLFLLVVQMEASRDYELGAAGVTIQQDNVERHRSYTELVHRVATDHLCTDNK